MNSGIRRRFVWMGAVAAVLLPWPVAWWLAQPTDRVTWDCVGDLEFVAQTDNRRARIWGELDVTYRPSGTGFARFIGFFQNERTGDATERVHRAAEFDYQSLGDQLRIHTTRATRQMNDSVDDETVYRFLPGLRADHTDYYQLIRVGSAAAVAYNDSPRIYCAPRRAATASASLSAPTSR
ncbi:hypothetical protein [Pandoraea anhela]|uniref:Uncharacterized protein n=1 Tax=Pandoraea anhela TaxID=2508295 RepID=A0A5E4T5Q5_9BURK|nr:hypothetical protein [Pandoraea anhela]VVD83506.1 hypothetical protein PAN31108_01234 [Pandoraea anhela]